MNGSSGENFLISKEQKKQIFRVVKETVGDDVNLIAQIGSLDLNEAIELGKYATELGYDALSAVHHSIIHSLLKKLSNIISTLSKQHKTI